MEDSIGKKTNKTKIILITNDQKACFKVKQMALKNEYEFANYTEDDWATFEDIEQYIQDDEISKNIISLPLGHRPVLSLEDVEAETIKIVINRVHGNAVKAAKTLNIGRATLYRKLEKYGLSLKQVRDQSQSKKRTEQPFEQLHIVKKAS